MDAISEVTRRAGVALVEDAAQAHGARWLDKRAGSFGAAAAFSFYPGKNLGAFGDAGAITTNDTALSERTPVVGRSRPAHWHQTRTRPIRTQQSPRRVAGRGAVDQAPSPRRLERVATLRSRPVSQAPGRYKLPGAPKRSSLDSRSSPRDRARAATGSGVERTRRARNRLGSPLSDPEPSADARSSSSREHRSRSPKPPPARSSPFRCSRRSRPTKSNACAKCCSTQRKGVRVELEAENAAPNRSWTPVVPVPSETVAVAMFQWKRLPISRAVVDALHHVRTHHRARVRGARDTRVSALGAKSYAARTEIYYPLSANNPSGSSLRVDRGLSTQMVAMEGHAVLDPVAAQVPHELRRAREERDRDTPAGQRGHSHRGRRQVGRQGAGDRRRDRGVVPEDPAQHRRADARRS